MKKYERNLKTWAIDRAIELAKVAPQCVADDSAVNLVRVSDILCAWVTETPKEWPVPTEDESNAMIADLEAKGEM